MKKLLNIFVSISIVFMITSCDEKEWPESNIELTSIYSATDFSSAQEDDALPFALEIYRNKPLLIEYVNANVLKSFKYFDFEDSSTPERFDVTYAIKRPSITDTEQDTLITYVYKLFGQKNDMKPDTLWYGQKTSSDTIFIEYYTTIKEKQVYN